MQSILQIFKVNEARSGEKDGRKWSIQECECALLDTDGVVQEVGVLSLPRELVGNTKPGIYMGAFALKAGYKDRKIGAVLTGLQPYAVKGTPPAPAPKQS